MPLGTPDREREAHVTVMDQPCENCASEPAAVTIAARIQGRARTNPNEPGEWWVLLCWSCAQRLVNSYSPNPAGRVDLRDFTTGVRV